MVTEEYEGVPGEVRVGEVRVVLGLLASVMVEVNVGVGGAAGMKLELLLCFSWRNSMKEAARVGSEGLVARSVSREA